MAEHDESRGPVPPYGQAIWDAAKRGDLAEMEHVADAARVAIAKGAKEADVTFEHEVTKNVEHFRPVPPSEAAEVRSALSELEKKIAELRPKNEPPQPQPPQGDKPSY